MPPRKAFGNRLDRYVLVALHLGMSPSEAGPCVTCATMIGGIAYLIMACAIFLSTRPRYLEDAFGGMDHMCQVHKVYGVNAGLLVILYMRPDDAGY